MKKKSLIKRYLKIKRILASLKSSQIYGNINKFAHLKHPQRIIKHLEYRLSIFELAMIGDIDALNLIQ